MILDQTHCMADDKDEAEQLLGKQNVLHVLALATPERVRKISISLYGDDKRAIYAVAEPRVIRILDNLIRDL